MCIVKTSWDCTTNYNTRSLVESLSFIEASVLYEASTWLHFRNCVTLEFGIVCTQIVSRDHACFIHCHALVKQ